MKKFISIFTLLAVLLFLIISCENEIYKNSNYTTSKRVENLLSKMTMKEKVTLLSRTDGLSVPGIERLRVPPLRLVNGPHGVGEEPGTCFPAGVAMAATWNEDLVNEVGIAIGEEALAKGCDILLAPTVNLHRIPIAGRNFESYSEDPFLSARMGINFINGVQSKNVAVSLKHYAMNNQEWDRYSVNVLADERTMREIYLYPFEKAVREAAPMTIMSAYNKINNIYGSHNSYLLNDILRKEWRFTGVVISDNGAIHDVEAAAKAGVDIENPGPQVYFGDSLLAAIQDGKITEQIIDQKVRRVLELIFNLGLMDEPQNRPKGSLNSPEHQTLARKAAEQAIVLLKNKNGILPLNKDKIETIAVIGPNASSTRLGGGGSSEVIPFYSVSPLDAIKKVLPETVKIEFNNGVDFVQDYPVVKSRFLVPPNGKSGQFGLKGEYFNNDNLNGNPVLVRIDKEINFDWGRNAPAEGINDNNFSVRWTGKIKAPKTGKIRLAISSNDGSKLYINQKLLVHNWGLHATKMKSNEIFVVKDREYEIMIEYFEAGNNANIKLEWQLDKPARLFDPQAVKIARKADIVIIFAGLNKDIEGEGFDRETMNLPVSQEELIKAIAAVNKNTIVVLNNGSPLAMTDWINDVSAIVEAWYLGQETGNAISDILFGSVNPSGKLPVTFPKKYEDNPTYNSYPGKDGIAEFKEGIFMGYRHYDKENIEPLFPFGYGLSYTTFEYSDLKLSLDKMKTNDTLRVSLTVTNAGKVDGTEVVQLYISDKQASVEREVKALKSFQRVSLKTGESKSVTMKIDKTALSFYDVKVKKWFAEPGEFEVLIGASSRDIRLKGEFELK